MINPCLGVSRFDWCLVLSLVVAPVVGGSLGIIAGCQTSRAQSLPPDKDPTIIGKWVDTGVPADQGRQDRQTYPQYAIDVLDQPHLAMWEAWRVGTRGTWEHRWIPDTEISPTP